MNITLTSENIAAARTDPRGECTCEYAEVGPDRYTRPTTDPECPVHTFRDAANAERAMLRAQADREHTSNVIAEAKRYQAELAHIDRWHALRLTGIDQDQPEVTS